MPDPSAVLGWAYDIYDPAINDTMALGYTHFRVYKASSRTGTYSLLGTVTLVEDQYDYTYNHTTGVSSDWVYHAPYGTTPGEGPATRPIQMGAPRATRKLVRQGVGRRLRMCKLATISSASSSTAFTVSSLIDADASAHKYANQIIRAVSGNVSGETTRSRKPTASPAGWAPTTGVFAVSPAFSTTPSANELEIWRPKGDEDTSALVDEAINRARHRILWNEDFILATDDGVTDYALPGTVENPGHAGWPQLVTGTYPEKPGWQDVSYFQSRRRDGAVWVTVMAGALERHAYTAGTIVRVPTVRCGDYLDTDTDYWECNLEWAIAETALEFLETLDSPSALFEDVKDLDRAMRSLTRELLPYRSKYMPGPIIYEELPA